MIVSHRHKFIFVKTSKTAGTSIEIALSEYCGPGDIITPIAPKDEQIRRAMGFRGPQNTFVPYSRYRWRDWIYAAGAGNRIEFFNHLPATIAKQWIGSEIWEEYFVFAFERNPFDKAVSRYYWSTRDSEVRPPIQEYLRQENPRKVSNWHLYTIEDEVAVDFVGRYEALTEDLSTVWCRLGLPGNPSLPRAKGGHRVDNRPYQAVLDDSSRRLIGHICKREIERFGYSY